jgi:hypothetical protein
LLFLKRKLKNFALQGRKMQAQVYVRVYALPVILALGSIFNLLSFLISRKIRTTAGFYVSILGISDLSIYIKFYF